MTSRFKHVTYNAMLQAEDKTLCTLDLSMQLRSWIDSPTWNLETMSTLGFLIETGDTHLPHYSVNVTGTPVAVKDMLSIPILLHINR